jgi:hypothetical protein
VNIVKLDHRSIRYWRAVNGRVDHEARNRYAAAIAVGLGILVCAVLAASAIASAS